MKTKLPIKKYVMDPNLPWADRYRQLESHHMEETKILLEMIAELEQELDDRNEQERELDER